MKTSYIMFTSEIFTDLCSAKQRTRMKNTLVKVVYIVLVVKM